MGSADTLPKLYVSRSTLAWQLDISESTVDEMVRRGVLPKPVRLSSGCVRWSIAAVERALASLQPGADVAAIDPFLAGADNATKGARARHG